MKNEYSKLIHLLYVPTLFCNMGCQYCYLGNQTEKSLLEDNERCVDTLSFALNKFKKEKVLPFNVSLHGGEVTTISKNNLDALFTLIKKHYIQNYDNLKANGFSKHNPHIKTNLLNLNDLYKLMLKHKVSISGSVDIPFSLHEKYRTTKSGSSTLKQIKNSLKLLGQYPYNKKISTTLYSEHLNNIDSLIEDIWYIHNELKFDMNNFNFMFGFESELNDQKFSQKNRDLTLSIPDNVQVQFYNKMKETFIGTELELGFRKNWFDEFSPSYCTNSINCGEKFFLLQSNGEMYSCVRGQGIEPFHYGNIFNDSVDTILSNGQHKILSTHQTEGFHSDCIECEYLHLCNTGCPFVKYQKHKGKSYTCALQKEIYKDNPLSYPPIENDDKKILNLDSYKLQVHPNLAIKNKNSDMHDKIVLPNDLHDSKNSLHNLIDNDSSLKELYSSEKIIFEQNSKTTALESQILKHSRSLYSIFEDESIFIHIHKSLFSINCNDIVRNTLYLQMLRDTPIIYGDEKRTKQEHLFTYQVYFNALEQSNKFGKDFLQFNLAPLLKIHNKMYKKDILNNLFITTSYLRDYHYNKQKNNAFYHVQAINLPFQNIEFYWEGVPS